MKHVYDTHEIAHLWMHQTQSDARNQQGNFYFDGDTIYSYGRHFPIARHVTNKRKERAILFTTRSYSLTTSRQINDVRRAIQGNDVTVIYLESITGSEKQTVNELDAQIITAQKDCFGPTNRFRTSGWNALSLLITRANAYTTFIGSRKRWTLPENSDGIKAQIAKDNARKAKEQKARDKKNKAEFAKRAIEDVELLEKWRNGESVDTYRFRYDIPVALRIVGDEVETSKGATFPVEHAKRGIAFVRAVVAKQEPYHRNGHTFHLGHYAIDSIDLDGTVHAGCHTVLFAEIERIATVLG